MAVASARPCKSAFAPDR